MSFWDTIIDSITRYYGVDWIVLITVFIGIYLLGEKKRSGFAVGMTSAAFSMILGIQVGSMASIVTALVIFSLYLRGYIRWHPNNTA